MTIEIRYNDKLYEQIFKKNAIVMGLSISNQSKAFDTINLDELQFTNSFVRITRNLPNDSSIEFLIYEPDESTTEKYKDLTNCSIHFNGIEVISKI